jgi:transketolase
MPAITSANVANAIVKLVAMDALPALLANLVMGNLVNRDYEPTLATTGDTVNVPIPGTLVANNIAEGTGSVQTQNPNLGNAQIVLNSHVEATFKIPDVTKVLAFPNLLMAYMEPAINAVVTRIDKLTKRNYGWPDEDAKFLVPDGVRERFQDLMAARGHALRTDWMVKYEVEYKVQFPELADQLYKMQHRQLPDGWDKDIPVFPADPKGAAGRDASAKALNAIAKNVPWLIGGSADLAPSTKTRLTFEGAGDFTAKNYGGRNLHFGIREHAMGSLLNGMALSKIRAYGSGFLIFSDFCRPSIRLSALMELPVTYIFTHDSIGVGEDGPTHQPVEQLISLRAIPGLITLRPGDPNEVSEAWRVIMKMNREPVCLILSRQNMPTLDRTKFAPATGVAKGAYVLADAPGGGEPAVILIGTGSEVGLCVDAWEKLVAEGVKARVVSMPSWELFAHQSKEYRDSVLPPSCGARVSVEQASTFGWSAYAERNIGMQTFGASAPLKELQKKFGFTPDAVIAAAKEEIAKHA